ncbi:DUF4287 domain-containing protein [Myxococcota bacterium]|nr:DUF4287 domain-containing protein [Myxococcota bacterium]
MSTPEQQLETQLRNIEARLGRSRADLFAFVHAAGERKHSELVALCKAELGLGHGDANTLVHCAKQSHGAAIAAELGAQGQDPADAWYAGKKAALRPVHDAVLAAVAALGGGPGGAVEHAPKKTYVSLRRKKQLATVGPATATQVEVGFNLKGVEGGDRLQALPPGGMCTHRVRLSSVAEVDAELVAWLRAAYEQAG